MGGDKGGVKKKEPGGRNGGSLSWKGSKRMVGALDPWGQEKSIAIHVP